MPLALNPVKRLNASMILHPAVTIHGLAHARAAIAPGLAVTLLSAPGAGLYAGCLWWRAVIDRVADESRVISILDCADGAGQAMAALRAGVCNLVLWRETPGWESVAGIAAARGGFVLSGAPPSLDLAEPGAARRLDAWLRAG